MTAQGQQRAKQDRSVKTQEHILDAAVSVLTTEGYAGATTLRIQSEAGVSRGRLLHHYPSRDDLLVAAVHHLAAARMDGLRERDSWPDDPGARIDEAIETMWFSHQQSYFWASTELWLAARHDERLRAALAPHERTLGKVVRATVDSFFGAELSAVAAYPDVVDILLGSMRGTALTYSFTGGTPETEPQLESWKRLARTLLLVEATPAAGYNSRH